MAIIGTIRNRGGSVLIGLIAVSLLLFVGNDLINPSNSGGIQSQLVGSIAGTDITYDEFQAKLKQREDGFRSSRGTSPNENEMAQLQEEVWNSYIYDIAFGNELDELGIIVHEEELYDLVQGDYVHPQLQQQFRGQDGNFNKNQLIQYLKFIGQNYDPKQMPVSEADFYKMKNNFIKFENELPLTRKVEKYNALLSKSTYVTSLEAKNKYIADNESVDAKVLYVPFMSILDSTINVTDEDLKAYLNENAKEYQQEETTKSLEYVVFPITASATDSMEVKEEILAMKEAFENSENDSLFVRAKADNPTMPVYSSLGNVPKLIQDMHPNVEEGIVIGPLLEAGAFKMFKVSGIKEDSVYSARASHILFKAASKSDEDLAIALADCKKVLAEIKAGADFAEMASIHGTDGTKNVGGDLGWFSEGKMVPEFNDAVMAATKEGVLPSPVKTDFGYHIIKITGVKTNINYQISVIDREISAGEETREIAYQKAAAFASDFTSLEEFRSAADTSARLQLLTSENIKSKDRFLVGAGNARRAVQWAFDEETLVGEVSDVIDLDGGYLVVSLAGSSDKGTQDLESVRNTITNKVIKQKKAEEIIAKLSQASGSLDDKVSAYGSNASIVSANGVTLSSSSIPGIGFDPSIAGAFIGMNEGEVSEPVVCENGVIIIEVSAKKVAADKQDFTSEKSMLLNQNKGKANSSSFEAIKKAAEIEDKRVQFM